MEGCEHSGGGVVETRLASSQQQERYQKTGQSSANCLEQCFRLGDQVAHWEIRNSLRKTARATAGEKQVLRDEQVHGHEPQRHHFGHCWHAQHGLSHCLQPNCGICTQRSRQWQGRNQQIVSTHHVGSCLAVVAATLLGAITEVRLEVRRQSALDSLCHCEGV